jgi:hypothetical protein
MTFFSSSCSETDNGLSNSQYLDREDAHAADGAYERGVDVVGIVTLSRGDVLLPKSKTNDVLFIFFLLLQHSSNTIMSSFPYLSSCPIPFLLSQLLHRSENFPLLPIIYGNDVCILASTLYFHSHSKVNVFIGFFG